MNSTVTIAGKGQLYEFVVEELASFYDLCLLPNLNHPLPKQSKLLLVLEDGWNPAMHYQAELAARDIGVDWLRGFVAFGEGVAGPWVRPGREGCSQCADTRRIMTAKDRQDKWKIQQISSQQQETVHDEWVSPMGLHQLAQIIITETKRIMTEKSSQLEEAVQLINMRTLETARHSILPDSLCYMCSNRTEDSPEEAIISLQPSPKISEDSYRCRSLKELSQFLSEEYLDPRTGLLNSKMMDVETPFADVIVNLPLMNGDEGSAGRTNSYAVSEMTAILEGLERSCGIDPKGKRTVVYDSYNQLDSALHPLQVGVHTQTQYAAEDFPFTPFDPDKKMNWVWGYSLQSQTSLLIPERLAYYSMGCGDGIMFETSNGCAIGGSLEEAIFYGIMEVLERDSFLMTWYGKLPLPRIDPYSVKDEELHLMIERMREVAGYDLYLYNGTMEHGIPCIFTIIKNRHSHPDELNLMCAAGAHLDPVKAVKSAISESIGMIKPLNKEFKQNKEIYKKMLHDSSLVRKMDDHGMLYGLPEAEERLKFLLDQEGPMQTFEDAFHWKSKHVDLTDDLRDILTVFQNLYMDVIVVDQTSSEISRNGLRCVKVLIPGMLPMTFGHHQTRLAGLNRVLTVPKELGYVNKVFTMDELNPHPHPFP
ncbi:TOMM precursor leader peptide-binding protein [Halobacillus rhizosphaerae]|uniref:TOMM precursor leader peptide-binding protein n=1 Tax=Halobacillus rhizosphaerae TaxID=3064889 RepID=UPI00398B17DC